VGSSNGEAAEEHFRDLEEESGIEDYVSTAFSSCHMTSSRCLVASLASALTWKQMMVDCFVELVTDGSLSVSAQLDAHDILSVWLLLPKHEY
jgi:hypothetical protein